MFSSVPTLWALESASQVRMKATRRQSSSGRTWLRQLWRGFGTKSLPEKADAVIVGGGVIGSSVAYHLSKKGWKNIVLLEQVLRVYHVALHPFTQPLACRNVTCAPSRYKPSPAQNKLTSGTTWHAAGLVGTNRGTSTETKLSVVGTQMYEASRSRTECLCNV